MTRIGVTGASGYVGVAVLAAARSRGWEVVALGRRPVAAANDWRPSDLSVLPDPGLLSGLDAVVHLAAYTGKGDDPGGGAEVAYATTLARQALARGIPCVIISSQAATPDAASAYGRTKHVIETATRPLQAVLLRPGMVVGGREDGLFGMLCRLVHKSPVLPRLWPAPQVQPVHVGDLAQAVLQACERADLRGEIVAVAGPAVAFHDLLVAIARNRVRRRRLWVPVPVGMLRVCLALASPILGAAASPERLDSLLTLPMLDPTETARRLGVELRPMNDAVARGVPGRRSLLCEGQRLARVLAGTAPPPSLLRRYVKLLQGRGIVHAIDTGQDRVPGRFELAAMDHAATRAGAAPGSVAWRMDVITRLCETEPALADRFMPGPGAAGRTRFAFDVAVAIARELRVRLASLKLRIHGTGAR